MAPPLVGWCCPKGLCVSGCAFSGGQGAKDPDRQELLSTCSGTGIRLPVVRNLQSHPSSSSPVNFQVSPCPIQGPVPFPLQGHSLLLKHSTLSCLLPSLLRLSVRAEALPASPYPSIPQGPLSCHLCPPPPRHPGPQNDSAVEMFLWCAELTWTVFSFTLCSNHSPVSQLIYLVNSTREGSVSYSSSHPQASRRQALVESFLEEETDGVACTLAVGPGCSPTELSIFH